MLKDLFQVKRHSCFDGIFATFEYINVTTRTAGFCLYITIIYRPPSTCLGQFAEEFSTLLEQLVMSTEYLLIVGDFNIHIDDSSNPEAAQFLSLIESFGLKSNGYLCCAQERSYP